MMNVVEGLDFYQSKILWITIGWTIISALNFLNGYATLRALDFDLPGGRFGLYIKAGSTSM